MVSQRAEWIRLGLRGWLITWAIAVYCGGVQSDPAKRLEIFGLYFFFASVFCALAVRRWALGCANGFLGNLAILNIAPHLHMPSFWSVPIGLWAGPLTLIVGLQLAAGGVGLGALLLNLAGYALVLLAARAAGASYLGIGLLVGWGSLVLTALAYGWLQQLGRQWGRPRLADQVALGALVALIILGIFLPSVFYDLGLITGP